MKTLVYIISSPRSGSTLLANILGNSPAFFNAGEVSSMDGFIREDSRQAKAFDNKCSCGNKFNKCDFWPDLLEKSALQLGVNIKDISTLVKLKTKSPLRILFKKRYLKSLQDDMLINDSGRKVANHAFAIFDNILRKTGCSGVIDSSKKITNLMAYNKYAPKDWNIKVIYIYREPEATALSVQKAGNRLNIAKDKGFFMNLVRCVHYNSLIKTYLKGQNHLSISLSELCSDFEKFEKEIVNFIMLPNLKTLSLRSSRRVRHDVGGSISVTKLGEKIRLKLDDTWPKELSFSRKLVSKVIKSI